MAPSHLPGWTVLPFPALLLALAVLPAAAPRAWERWSLQAAVVASCALPVVVHLVAARQLQPLGDAARTYASFVATIGALYVTSGGIRISGDLAAKPSTNVAFVLLGSVLANLIGTTGASMLLIRPLLRTNRQRQHRAHLVPLFIVSVSNAGGLLTPLGGPLLVGYIAGVPFFWTLRLLPAWLLYVGSTALVLHVLDTRAYACESPAALAHDAAETEPLALAGKRNVALLLAVAPAALLPFGVREAAMAAIAVASLLGTPAELRRASGFTFGPILEVALVFAGLFVCLGPVQEALAQAAPELPVHRGWQLFWVSGLLSSVLDNAPTYSAMIALGRGLSVGAGHLVAGVTPHKLAAISIGSVVWGATTYVGNGSNLIVRAMAERARYPMPSFVRYALFAFAVMLPAHLVTTLALALLDR